MVGNNVSPEYEVLAVQQTSSQGPLVRCFLPAETLLKAVRAAVTEVTVAVGPVLSTLLSTLPGSVLCVGVGVWEQGKLL